MKTTAAGSSESTTVTPCTQGRVWCAWAVWAGFFVVVVLGLCRPWYATEVPAAATVANQEFSAERAFVHIEALATRLGRRVTGTAACVRAADYIEGELRRLGVETARQVADGTTERYGKTYVYRGVTNVLARLPGASTRAILVSAHYDSVTEGPGAGDNALGVAVALEVVRALQASGGLHDTVIFNFNGGEEYGLLGAATFLHHPWFADVAGFINLDASGGQGRQLLFQVTPGGGLVEAYATLARHVHGTVFAQEIFSLLPFDTDSHVYRNAGLAGFDLAPYGDTYSYHTALDRADRMSRRTLQESGENVLAILRGLRTQDFPRDHAGTAPYYDVLGVVMVRYSAPTGLVLGLVAGVLALVLAWWPRTGGQRSAAMLALGVASVALSALLACLVPVVVSIFVTLAGRAMSWYARPWSAACVYGTFTVVGALAGQGVLQWIVRRRRIAGALVIAAVQRGLVVFWAGILLLTTALGLGSAYLPLWWCIGSAIAMVASSLLHGASRWIVTLVGFTMAALTTAQAAQLLLVSLIPLTGMLGLDAPVESVIAAVTALALAPFALVLAPSVQASVQASSPRLVAAVTALAVSLATGLIAFSFPYTEAQPKRVYVEARAGGGGGPRVVFQFIDPGPAPGLAAAPLASEVLPPMPTIEVNPSAPAAPGAIGFEVRLVATGAHLVDMRLDGPTSAWSLGSGASNPRRMIWVGTDEPLVFRVEKTTTEPVRIHLKAYYPGSNASLDHALTLLPNWTVPAVQTVLEASANL